MNYFDKIPTISYNGYDAKNLLVRAKLSDRTKANKTTFYPYTMDESDRVDLLSDNYYDNPGYTWLIWFANEIVDPYYDMPLSYDDFGNYIITKYGSIESAQRKIKHYRSNWYSDETRLTPTQFSGLTPAFQKYYQPIVNTDYVPTAYIRKKEDLIVNTNRVVTLSVSNATGTFTIGEEVKVNGNNYGFVTFANTTAVTCQHITGQFAASNVITGQESGITATVTASANVITTIAALEPTYWTAVSFYDYEEELNANKKEIVLLDVRYKNQAEAELKKAMRSQ